MRAAARARAEGEMAERSAARRRKARRHPDRRRERAGFRRRHRHRRQLRQPSGRHALFRRPISRPPARWSTPDALLAALGDGDAAPAGAMGARRGLCRRSAPTGSSAPPASAKTSACGCRSANLPAAFKGSMRPGGCCCEQPDGVIDAITAGEVFALGRTLIMAQAAARTGVRAARRRRRDRHEPVDLRPRRRAHAADGWRSISACRSPPKSICRAST